MKGSMENLRMFNFLETIKLKFEDSPYVLHEVFSLQYSFFCHFITFSKHFKLIEFDELLLFSINSNFKMDICGLSIDPFIELCILLSTVFRGAKQNICLL